MNNEYTVDSIEVLSDIEHIRLRPGMYIGECSDPRQLFSEAFDNALDESQSGYSSLTTVRVDTKNNSYEISDEGRGIPIGLKYDELSGSELETLEILCTRSFSGGKFNRNSYKVSSGVHGVGLCCINSLSEDFTISTHRDGEIVRFHSNKGVKTNLEKVSYKDESSGVSLKFTADKSIFDTVVIPIEFIIDRCRVASAFGYNVDLYIDDVKQEISHNSLDDLIPADNTLSTYAEFSISCSLESGESIKVLLKYMSSTDAKYYGYTNLLYNRYGGTHIKLINKSIENVWSNFYHKDSNLKSSDCTAGLRCLCAVFISDIAFSSQTKDKLTSKSESLVLLVDKFSEEFKNQLESNPEITEALLSRFQEYRDSQNKLRDRKNILDLIKINNESSSKSNKVRRRSVVSNLIECSSSKLEGTELFIVEGNSAAGTAARARNKKLQAVLPLRGKIKNITYKSVADAVKYETVLNIINAVGAGAGDDTDASKCRYEKIIISADSDADGQNIAALVMSVFINLTPDLVKEGRVYLLEPPLYGWKNSSGDYQFVDTVNDIPRNILDSKKFTRYKGLGEMDDIEYKVGCMTPGNRRLYRIEYPSNLDEFNKILGTTSGRRELLKDLGLIRYVSLVNEDDTSCDIEN